MAECLRKSQGDDGLIDPGENLNDDFARRGHGASSGCCFPDPDPDPADPRPKADDVTRMNATVVDRIVYVRNDADIKRVLYQARAEGKRVSARGTKHSMGGQSIAEGAIIIDMTKMTEVSYDPATRLVTCDTGCTFVDLIRHLNQYGMSPRTMQSYSSFSIGGTLSVNGHGITTDFTVSEGVQSFRLIKWDGTEVVCSREATGEARELFGLALGGYGLFGIMWQVTMKADENVRMIEEPMHMNPDEFTRFSEAVHKSDDVVMKLARLNIIDLNHIDFFVFRRESPKSVTTVSDLDRKPRELTWKSRLMYKWLMPVMKEARYTIEKNLGQALDWSSQSERNLMLFESAAPLAQLYEPLFRVDDTFVLQEFFCPRSSFKQFLALANPVYAELAKMKGNEVILLNTTIRVVNKDKDTALPYAKADEAMFAFVLYYRVMRTPEADAVLHKFHSKFVKIVLELNGTFYLPYRLHYTHEELESAYPGVREFFAKKEKYDPHGVFDNKWFRHYGPKYLSTEYSNALEQPLSQKFAGIPPSVDPEKTPRCASERRSNSYHALLSSSSLRRDFKDGFLTQIFNVLDNNQLFRMIVKATRDPDNKTDIEVYRALQRSLGQSSGPMSEASKVWKQLKQLSSQKKEFSREVCSIVTRLGKFGQVHDYLCVGDAGKMVLPLRKVLGMNGKCWIAHHDHSDDIPIILERGSVEHVAEAVYWELLEAAPFRGVPDASVDLVTMLQGLHHLRQDRVIPFLTEVKRVLRPGGMFIVREHDASESLIPMLDLAHSVFNAVLGVSDKEEETEIRAFRPVQEWREIIESVGLVDSSLYEIEPDDPTWDEMMCFYKTPLFSPEAAEKRFFQALETQPVFDGLPPAFAAVLEQAPRMLLSSLVGIIDGLLRDVPPAVNAFKQKMKILSAGQSLVAEQIVDQAIGPFIQILERFRPSFENVELTNRDDSGLSDLIPSELFLLVPALLRKAEQGRASANELFVVAIIKDIQIALMGSSGDGATEEAIPAAASEDTAPKVSVAEVQALLEEVSKAFPEMRRPEAMKQVMGLNDRAEMALRSQMSMQDNPDINDVSTQLASYLDEQAWDELRAALLEAVSQKRTPNADLVFGRKGEDNAWCRATMAFLGSKHVQFKPAALTACAWVGLGDVAKMWKLAQGLRSKQAQLEKSGQLMIAQPELVRSKSDEQRRGRIVAAMEGIVPGPKEVQMAEGKQWDLKDVSEIISATFGYESLTARLKDITKELQKKQKGNCLKLRKMDLQQEFGIEDAGLSALDGIRKTLARKTRHITIKYRSSAEPPPEDFMPRVTTLLDRLSALGVTDKMHADDGEYTWYKLNEWMQVEILQIFGNNMEHTPWYRFPYTKFLKIYFDTLVQEAGIVNKKFGPKKAFGSMGFITSLVPGVVMAMLFGQIQVLALPLLAMPDSSGFGESYDASKTVEQLVVMRPADAADLDWHKIDERISNVRCPTKGLFIMSVPTFKPLTEILKKMAEQQPTLRVLEISHQRHIQVRVGLRNRDTDLQMLNALPGCEVMFDYKYPTDGSQDDPCTMVSLCVSVPYVLLVLRACASEGSIEVCQIYDFYC